MRARVRDDGKTFSPLAEAGFETLGRSFSFFTCVQNVLAESRHPRLETFPGKKKVPRSRGLTTLITYRTRVFCIRDVRVTISYSIEPFYKTVDRRGRIYRKSDVTIRSRNNNDLISALERRPGRTI